MAYCDNCGNELLGSSKFCPECGQAVKIVENTRKISYEGEVHKCPNCGDVIDAYEMICEACGFEIRGRSTSNSVQDFFEKYCDASDDKQKESIIRNFPVPNTKEDIFEFMILASSNIDEHPNNDVFKSWIAKFEQCYQKAKLSFKTENDFIKIQAIHDRTQKNIKKIRRKGPMRKIRIFLIILIANVIFWGGIAMCGHIRDLDEIERLEGVVQNVESAIESKDYELAMNYAKTIDYYPNHESSDTEEYQWDTKRDYLIKKIISAAAKDGIIMEYPSDTADEKDSVSTFEWESDGLFVKIPKPDTNKGKIILKSDSYLQFELYNIEESYFKEYVDTCKEQGFNLEVSDYSTMYSAQNELGNSVAIYFSSNKMTVTVQAEDVLDGIDNYFKK